MAPSLNLHYYLLPIYMYFFFLSQTFQDNNCSDLFVCSSVCMEWSMVCDGYASCYDGSDEENCDIGEYINCLRVTKLYSMVHGV